MKPLMCVVVLFNKLLLVVFVQYCFPSVLAVVVAQKAITDQRVKVLIYEVSSITPRDALTFFPMHQANISIPTLGFV